MRELSCSVSHHLAVLLQERVIALVINSTSVLEHPAIADVAEESLHSEASALDNIQDTDKALVRSRALVNSYRPLSVFSALVFTTAQRLCQTLNYNRLSLEQFQELVATLLARHRNTRSSDDPAACHEHTALMQRKILLELHQLIMLPRQHLLLPLLVGLAQLVAAGEVSSEEQSALAEDPTLLQHQLSISTESGLRPTWLSQQVSLRLSHYDPLTTCAPGMEWCSSVREAASVPGPCFITEQPQ